MIANYIKLLTLEALKHFFNIEPVFCQYGCTLLYFKIACLKISWFRLVEELVAGVNTVKDDIAEVRSIVSKIKEEFAVPGIAQTK